MKRIAIQGIKGSFHDIAARQFFEDEEVGLVCCDTFEEMFARLKGATDMLGLMAIENTIAGSLLHNYELLRDSGMTIVGEHKLRISHSIMCLPDEGWDDLREVNSHPVALMQCRNVLSRHHELKVVEVADTAGAAADISREQRHGHAAICHKDAARIYGMKVLQEGIETNKHNFTRFLVLAHPEKATAIRNTRHIDKASLVFTLPHEEGSLSAILSVLEEKGLIFTLAPTSIYRPDSAPHKNLSFHLSFSSPKKTLDSAEISAIIETIVKKLSDDFHAEIV